MGGYIEKKVDVNQYSFMPMCYDEIISQDNPVRVLATFIDALNMEKLNFTHSNNNTSKRGRPSYNPKDMLKLYLYGYFNGIRSSRKLERECQRNVELFWLIGQLKPDFKTIADFRKNNIKNMEALFVQFSLLCDELKLVGKEIVAIDGSKFRASNARLKNYTKGKVEKQIKYYQENVEKYMKLLDEEDSHEVDNKVTLNKEEIQIKIQEAQKRIEELEEMKEKIKQEGEISITDPDSRHMKANNNGTDIAHNVQIGVDSKEHLVVAVDVTSSPADQGQLYGMAKRSQKALNVEEITVLADKGYWSGNCLKNCEENGIKAIVSKPEEAGNVGYKRADFKYNESKDCYICPAGKELYKTGKEKIVYKNPKACKQCPNRDKCTKNSRGRTLGINENQKYLNRAAQRQQENMELYKQRQKIVEHVFGTVKRALGYTHFLLRGNEKVKGESFMHFLIYNIKRVCNIKSIEEIIEAIQAKKKENTVFNFTIFSFLVISMKFGSLRIAPSLQLLN